MGNRSEWRLLAALLVVTAALALVLSPGGARSVLDPRPSAFRATPNGALGLYLLFEELGIPSERRVTPLVDGEPFPAALVLLAPSEPLSPAETGALLQWIDGGGRLLYGATPGDTLLEEFGLALVRVRRDSAAAAGIATATPASDHPYLAGVERVDAFAYAFADSSPVLSAEAVPLLALDDEQVGAVLLPRGEGMVMAWSGTGPLVNRSLQSGGAAVILSRAARDFVAGGGAIQFDEYHQGFRGGGSPVAALLAFLRDTRAGRMTLQLGLVAAGLLLLLGSRFGTAIAPAPVRRRSPLEHLHALAAAYRTGNARNRARHLLLVGAARRLGRRAPAPGDEREFLAMFGTSSARREAADAVIGEWEKGDQADLITLANQVDRLVVETNAS